ncbi:Protein CBR-ELT-7 [Caenorhabditis briggsae]|nr:Protein CBR-ELT-7 [Caenorhabditis briggsae]ULT86534.1 hypothetical protein L3Y34_006318 [Caenorhabditis briggsae]CAP28571.2 Protein CBR-ELT-7 [Caenorhabditis briggsae]
MDHQHAEPLPSLSTVLAESSTRNQKEDLYLYDQFSNQSTFFNYPYPGQPVYYNPWQYSTLQPYDVYQYPMLTSYDQTIPVQPPIIDISTHSNVYEKPASVETAKTSSPESFMEHKTTMRRPAVKRTSSISRNCANCSTTETSLWRKNEEGDLECNACNLYFRLNKVKRPLELCNTAPKTRKRRSRKAKKNLEEED